MEYMQYKSFSLKNYKGIKEHLTFDITTGIRVPHCIIGNNESGKTTILKGIERISKLCKGKSIEDIMKETKENIHSIKPKGDYFSDAVTLRATLSCPKSIIKDTERNDKDDDKKLSKYLKNGNEIDISLEFTYEFKNASFVENSHRTNIQFDGSVVTDERDKEAIFNLISNYAPDVIYYDDFKFAIPEVIRFLASTKKGDLDDNETIVDDNTLLTSEENIFWKEVFTDILRGYSKKKDSDFQKDVVDLTQGETNDIENAASRLDNMCKYLDDVLKEWVKSKQNNIEGFRISIKPVSNNIFHDYQISIRSGSDSYKLNERSKGFQWAFCFQILTKIRQNRSGEGFIFLLDEPANNLHIRPQHEMLSHLNELCDDKNVVIYSTHAPELIGISKESYEHTFIAKNTADEFQKYTDIYLYKIKEGHDNIDVQDFEPILARLSYEDVKNFAKEETVGEQDEKSVWGKIFGKIKTSLPTFLNLLDFAEKIIKIISKKN